MIFSLLFALEDCSRQLLSANLNSSIIWQNNLRWTSTIQFAWLNTNHNCANNNLNWLFIIDNCAKFETTRNSILFAINRKNRFFLKKYSYKEIKKHRRRKHCWLLSFIDSSFILICSVPLWCNLITMSNDFSIRLL